MVAAVEARVEVGHALEPVLRDPRELTVGVAARRGVVPEREERRLRREHRQHVRPVAPVRDLLRAEHEQRGLVVDLHVVRHREEVVAHVGHVVLRGVDRHGVLVFVDDAELQAEGRRARDDGVGVRLVLRQIVGAVQAGPVDHDAVDARVLHREQLVLDDDAVARAVLADHGRVPRRDPVIPELRWFIDQCRPPTFEPRHHVDEDLSRVRLLDRDGARDRLDRRVGRWLTREQAVADSANNTDSRRCDLTMGVLRWRTNDVCTSRGAPQSR